VRELKKKLEKKKLKKPQATSPRPDTALGAALKKAVLNRQKKVIAKRAAKAHEYSGRCHEREHYRRPMGLRAEA
jgi:hypothetical protein